MDPVVLASARKHGIPDTDMLHAYHHPIRVFDLDGLTMLVGADASGRLLEVGVAVGDGVDLIVDSQAPRAKLQR
ncbi:MAG: hypothetical protein ACK4V6_14920, partial [Microthrixaceae bacterium]